MNIMLFTTFVEKELHGALVRTCTLTGKIWEPQNYVLGNETDVLHHLLYWKYCRTDVFHCLSFVATVHANVTLLVHWSSNVSGNETGVIHISHLSYWKYS